MKKDRNLGDVLTKVHKKWYRRHRNNKQLVIIELHAAALSVSCWLNNTCLWLDNKSLNSLWQEEEPQDSIWWQELEQELRDILLWARVPDAVGTIMLLDEQLVRSEVFAMPLLSKQELNEAIEWEAVQIIPWKEGSYNTAYIIENDEFGREQVHLWAWQRSNLKQAVKSLGNLGLKVEAILAGSSINEICKSWYEGDVFEKRSLYKGVSGIQYVDNLSKSRFPRWACMGCLGLAIAIYGCSLGGRYAAAMQLQGIKQELLEYEEWQQRYLEIQGIERRINRYKLLEQSLAKEKTSVGKSITQLGQQISSGCWFSVIRTEKKGVWELQGVGYDANAIARFVERLQASGKYNRVHLQNTHEEQGKAQGLMSFTVQIQEK